MADYNKWTKDDLIARVKELENEAKSKTFNAGSSPGGGMDPNKFATRFVALKLAYLGKRYNGFEYQCSGLLSTIEEELWKALVKACLIFPNPEKPNEVDWNVCEYSKCGRTDRGVSAFGQVVALREIQYAHILNRLLPPDIKVYAWAPNPPPEFSARFSCRERQYRYFFTQPAFQPLPNFLENEGDERKQQQNKTKRPSSDDDKTNDDSARPKPKEGWLDIDAMREAAKHFQGVHDFRNFCKVDASKQITNFTRRIFEADIVEVDGVDTTIPYLSSPQFRDPHHSPAGNGVTYPKIYYFHVRGSAFLWHQIRCMVAVLFLVGQGLESPTVVADLLDPAKHPRRPAYVLAEDTPLVLWDCLFGRDNEDGSPDEVDWLYVGEGETGPLSLHGGWGVAGELWEYWREKKMDEILANRLLDWVANKTGVGRTPSGGEVEAARAQAGKTKMGSSTRVYEGGHGPRYVGNYVPLLKKDLLQSPEDMNDRWAQRKGFNNAEEMRAIDTTVA
ncbi:hypothetical protein VMCG_07404 [Cytospora schulzeri]|uniref:Pseudouridine synthase I TruA alpha/beta domain-containing protein n=1 Tax=Cytospora schulzeri TaxID=448051 RepID=A0A423W386_9PEZI|nr:hypothetical protein VMCG_07404 [Valsa malicola]